MKSRGLLFFVFALPWACDGSGASPALASKQTHSSSIAISRDTTHLYVVHPDADSVSVIDLTTRTIQHEIPLGTAPPSVDAATGRFDPAVLPRALALDSAGLELFVTGERSGMLYAIDTRTAAITGSVAVCSEPAGVLVDATDSQVYVACSGDDAIVQVDAATMTVVSAVATPRKPWALGWAPDGTTLLTTHLLGPGATGVTPLTTSPLAVNGTSWAVPDRGPTTDPTEPHGLVRGIYDVVSRPGSNEIWVPHLMLGTDTPQPALTFNNTVFPALSVLDGKSGAPLARLSVQASTATPGDNGAFGDIVSGPRSMTFSGDGKFAFIVDTDSEDLLVVDAVKRTEVTVIRPLPGHLPEGVIWAEDELFIQERNTEDVVAFRVQELASADGKGTTILLVQDGDPIKTLATDPMPANLRLGQKLFYSANSDDVPLTQNHWVACATCHVEGRSDAVTWLFAQGPRDTPTNAGGMLDTGFLFRTGDRSKVQDYWKTIDIEQGGQFHPAGAQQPMLDAIADFVNYAIPAPAPPTMDATHQLKGDALKALRAQGEAVFNQVGCPTCHSGSAKTDSGAGNASLFLAGPIVSKQTNGGVLLHDVGTCATGGPWPDVVHEDINGDPRPACLFDTPALRGLADSAPYLHDGSAATLTDVLPIMLKVSTPTGAPPVLSDADKNALLEYLRGL